MGASASDLATHRGAYVARIAVCAAIALPAFLGGCSDPSPGGAAAGSPTSANVQERGGLVVYVRDTDLTRADLTEKASVGHVLDALDPQKEGAFVKSGYEKAAAFQQRISAITGPANRYVLVMPALLKYDADTGQASFCPKDPISTAHECIFSPPSVRRIDLGGWAAGSFSGVQELDVSANRLDAPVIPFKISVPASDAKRADDDGTARLAFVFTLDQPLRSGRFGENTTSNMYDSVRRAKVTLRRVVAYEQGGAVLGARDF